MLIRCQDGITAKPSAERVTRVEEGIHQCVAWQLRNSIIFFENAVEAQKMEHIPCAFPQHRHLLQHGNSISWHFSWGSGGGASGWRQLFETLLLAYILQLICELCSKWSNPDLDTSEWYCSTVVCCGTAFLGSFRWTLYYSHTRANILKYTLSDSRFNLFSIRDKLSCYKRATSPKSFWQKHFFSCCLAGPICIHCKNGLRPQERPAFVAMQCTEICCQHDLWATMQGDVTPKKPLGWRSSVWRLMVEMPATKLRQYKQPLNQKVERYLRCPRSLGLLVFLPFLMFSSLLVPRLNINLCVYVLVKLTW